MVNVTAALSECRQDLVSTAVVVDAILEQVSHPKQFPKAHSVESGVDKKDGLGAAVHTVAGAVGRSRVVYEGDYAAAVAAGIVSGKA